MQSETSVLRDAILRMWIPAVGSRSLHELMLKRITKSIVPIVGDSGIAMIFHYYSLGWSSLFLVDSFFDNRPPFEISEIILSGSWSEGLPIMTITNISFPDVDYMCVLKNISFSEDDQQAGNLTLMEDTPFVYAYIIDEDATKVWSDFLVDEGKFQGKRLSSKKLKEKLQGNYFKLLPISNDDNSNDVGTGAAININVIGKFSSFMKNFTNNLLINECFPDIDAFGRGEVINNFQKLLNKTFTGCDIVLSISCDGWPSCAKEWTMRERIWPSEELIQKITNAGFHIVPKSSMEGDFRLSFSCAETTLIENLTELQHKVLYSFKAVVKYHQNSWSPNVREIVTTYHLETVAFWHFEKLAQDSVTEETFVNHLVLLLQELARTVRKRELPMYFMPRVNLFRNIEFPQEAADIADKIEQLRKDFCQIGKAIHNTIIIHGFGEADNFSGMLKIFEEHLTGFLGKKKQTEEISSHKMMHMFSTIMNNVPRQLHGSHKLDTEEFIDVD